MKFCEQTVFYKICNKRHHSLLQCDTFYRKPSRTFWNWKIITDQHFLISDKKIQYKLATLPAFWVRCHKITFLISYTTSNFVWFINFFCYLIYSDIIIKCQNSWVTAKQTLFKSGHKFISNFFFLLKMFLCYYYIKKNRYKL